MKFFGYLWILLVAMFFIAGTQSATAPACDNKACEKNCKDAGKILPDRETKKYCGKDGFCSCT